MNATIRALAVTVAVLSVLGLAEVAVGVELYVTGESAVVSAIDPDAHTVTPVATVSFPDAPWPPDIAASAIAATCDGTIYLARVAYHTLSSTIGGFPLIPTIAFGEGRDGFLYVGEHAALLRVDPANGSMTEVGTGSSDYLGDLASDPATGELYGVTADGLVRVSKLDGSQTIVGPRFYDLGLAFTADGRLWANPCSHGPALGNNLCEVDKETGSATFVMDLAALSPDTATTFDLASQTSCDDANPCTDDVCTPLGLCQHVDNAAPCEDGNSCTGASVCALGACPTGATLPDGTGCTGDGMCYQATAGTCAAGVCESTPTAAGTPCSDEGLPCTVDECDGSGTCAHGEAPRVCLAAGKATLSIGNSYDDPKDKFALKLSNAPATAAADFGDPTAKDVYAACIYANASLVLQTHAAPSGRCDGKLCWQASKTGFKFKSKSGGGTGITGVTLNGSTKPATKLAMKGKGANLADPALPFAQPVVAQIVNARTGQCFAADFSNPNGIKKNSLEGFKATARVP